MKSSQRIDRDEVERVLKTIPTQKVRFTVEAEMDGMRIGLFAQQLDALLYEDHDLDIELLEEGSA